MLKKMSDLKKLSIILTVAAAVFSLLSFVVYVNSRAICFADVEDISYYMSVLKSFVFYLGKNFSIFTI